MYLARDFCDNGEEGSGEGSVGNFVSHFASFYEF
jgi:hypothetical protein